MAPQAYTDVYLESVEAATYTGEELNQVWNAPTLGAYMGKLK